VSEGIIWLAREKITEVSRQKHIGLLNGMLRILSCTTMNIVDCFALTAVWNCENYSVLCTKHNEQQLCFGWEQNEGTFPDSVKQEPHHSRNYRQVKYTVLFGFERIATAVQRFLTI